MSRLRKPKERWTFKACRSDALKYKSRTEWERSSNPAYTKAGIMGWRDRCCSHMDGRGITNRKPRGYWTLESCKRDALKYKSRSEWQDKSGSAIGAARKNGWMKQCTVHMVELEKPKGHWSLENCKKDALQYESRSAWENRSGSAYNKALTMGWVDDAVPTWNVSETATIVNCMLLNIPIGAFMLVSHSTTKDVTLNT